MKILIALSEMELPARLTGKLSREGNEVVTAADAETASRLAASGQFDAALIQKDLPGADLSRIVSLLHGKGTPVAVALKGPLGAELLREPEAESYITFPFTSAEIAGTLAGIVEKASSGRKFDLFGIEIDVAKFTVGGAVRLTNEEIDVLEAAKDGKEPPSRRLKLYARSLNEKLSRFDRRVRIGKIEGKGYRTMIVHEWEDYDE